jgi:hypothetical protein
MNGKGSRTQKIQSASTMRTQSNSWAPTVENFVVEAR